MFFFFFAAKKVTGSGPSERPGPIESPSMELYLCRREELIHTPANHIDIIYY
jgi:hypothetical protein